MPPEAAGKTIEVWFQDEARVGQKGTLSYQWAPRGSRPPAVRDNRHDSAYIFGAVCPARAIGAAIVTPSANSEAMTIHLAEIGKQVCLGAYAVLVCDGAGWHQTGQRLTVPDNVALLRLPPYSPELNPIENVWEYLRANQLNRRVWDSYDDIVEACCAAWNWFIADAARVASITVRKWASVNS
ncbi:MAG: IS630 family transposase [Hyphomicrobium sp.]|nr:IS630 family transposase [Hyphomicrobium sp.]